MSIDFSKIIGSSDSKGVITQITDALGKILWSAVKKAKVTITSQWDGFDGDSASITITSEKPFAPDPTNPSNKVTSLTFYVYDQPNCTIEVPKGSTIECAVSRDKGNADSCIKLNGTKMVTGEGTYIYTVMGDVTINIAEKYIQGDFGVITISEVRVVEYYGVITPLSVGRAYLAATSVGNYALFGGGQSSIDGDGSSGSDVVDAYDLSLTRTIPTPLSEARKYLSATTVGNYALFGGGLYGSSTRKVVDAYDQSLTRTIPTSLSMSRAYLAATSIGNYALFGGGGFYDTVDAYDLSLTRTIPTPLSEARDSLAATTVGGYALFGGGNAKGNIRKDTVDAYNLSLTRTIPTPLSAARFGLKATSVGDYALFGGGYNSSYYDTVDAYDLSLTRTIPTPLSAARYNFAATTVDGCALFGGGIDRDVVDAYDQSLTRTIPTPLSEARDNLAATTVGGYALFGGGAHFYFVGGSVVSMYFDVVEAYTTIQK